MRRYDDYLRPSAAIRRRSTRPMLPSATVRSSDARSTEGHDVSDWRGNGNGGQLFRRVPGPGPENDIHALLASQLPPEGTPKRRLNRLGPSNFQSKKSRGPKAPATSADLQRDLEYDARRKQEASTNRVVKNIDVTTDRSLA